MTRNLLQVFVLSLVCLFLPIRETNAQGCSDFIGWENEGLIPDRVCAPVTVTWNVTFVFSGAQDPSRVFINYFWDDPATSTTTVLGVASSGNRKFTASESFSYPAGTDCSYSPRVRVFYDADGSGTIIGSERCVSTEIIKTISSWARDNENSGVISINPMQLDVCVDDSLDAFQFQDNSTPNCEVGVEPDRPNEASRWVRFTYGTNVNAGPYIPNVEVDTGGGTVQITDAGGNIIAPFVGPVIFVTSPVQVGDLNELAYPISYPLGADIGDIFEITLDNWNTCNAYDTVTFDMIDPPVNGHFPPVSEQAIINVIGPTPATAGPDQDVCSFSTNFSGNTPATGTGTWTQLTGAQTATITNANDPTSAVSISSFSGGSQTYTFEWATALGGCASSVDTVQITFYRNPNNPNAGADQDICGLTTTMSANNISRGTGQWVQTGGPVADPGFSSVFDRNATLDVSTSGYGIYTFDWTASNPPCAPKTNEIVVTFEQDPTVPDAGLDDTTVCNSLNYTMQGNAIAVGTGTWSKVSGPGGAIVFTDPNDENTNITLPTFGTFVLRWTASNGTICPDLTDDVTISAFQTPTVSAAGPDSVHCGLTINLYGNTPTVGTGSWLYIGGPGAATIADPTDPNSSVTVSAGNSGVFYRFRWDIENGNCPVSQDFVRIIFGPPADDADAGPDDSVCAVSTYALNGNSVTATGGTGQWNVISGPDAGSITFVDDTLPNTTMDWSGVTDPDGPSTWLVTWTVTKPSCPTTIDTVSISVFPIPTPAVVTGANPRITCALTENLTANALTEGNGEWVQVAGPGTSTFVDSSSNSTNVTVSQSGYYRFMWEVTSGPCSPPSRDTLDVDFTSPTPSIAGNDTAVCRNFDTLNANTPTVGTGTWSAVPAAGVTFDNINDPNAEVTVATFGTYRLFWTITAGGCTNSIDSLDIRFDEVPTAPAAGVDTSVCQNNITMYANAPAVGSGRWRQISGTGSLTIANVNLPNTLVTAPAFSVSSTFELEWATFEGVCDTLRDTIQVTFFESPTNPAAGTDFEVCSNATNLAGNAISVGTGTWMQVSGPSVLTITSPNSETSAINIGAFVNDSDTFLVEWSSSNGNCAIERDTVQVIFHDDPTTSMAGGDIDICADTAIMAANVATVGTGMWTQISGSGVLTIDDPTNPTTTVRDPVFGANDSSIYLLEWDISNGNCTNSKDTVQVVFFLDPDIADAGGNDAICALTYTLGANTPPYVGKGLWTSAGTNPGASTFIDDTDEATDVTVTAYGLYKFYWTLSNGPCNPTIDSVLIRFDEFPSSSNAGVDDTVCDITYTLNGNVPAVGNGEWSLVSGPGTATFVDSSVANTVVTVSTIGTYEFEWRISNGVCADSTDNVIIIFASSNANTGVIGDTVQCIGASNEVYNIPFVAGTTYEWIIPPQIDSLFGGGTLDNFYVLEFNTAGTYTIGVIPTNNFGCSSDTQTTDVTVYDFPTIDAGPDFGICSGDTVTLGGAPTASGGSGSLGYNWFPTSGLDDATAANPRAFPTFTRSYFLTVFDSISGCLTAEDTAVVTVNSSPSSQLLVLDPSICEGDSARLLITIPTGVGPFSVSLTTGPDTLVFPSVSANDTLLVGPDSTVTYSVIALFDSATSCSGTTFLGTATVNVRALPTATLSAIDTVICEGEIVNLNISVSGPTPQIYTIEYAKNGRDTTTVNIVGSSGVINEAPDSTTLYTLISVTDNFRSCRVDAPSTSFTDSVLIQVDSLPRANLTGGDTICAGDSAALVANITEGDGPFTVIITNLGTITNYNSGDTIWVLPTSTTIYSLASVTDTNSCEATGGGLLTGTPTVVVNPLPVAQLLGDATICFGDTTDLSVLVTVGTGPYTVVIDNGDTVMNYNNLDPIPVAPTVTTTYNLLEVTDTFGCSTFAPSASLTGSPQVTVNPLPTAQVQSDDTVCFGETSVLTFSMTGATPFTVTFRNNTTGQDSTISTVGVATSINLTLGPDTTTVYSLVSVTDGNGCIDSINNPVSPGFGDSVEIFVRPKPAANLRADTTICAGETGHLFVDVTSGVAPFTINMNGIGVINNYQSGDTIFVSPTDTTTFFIIQLTDSNGCVVSAGDTLLPDTVVFNVNPLPFGDLSGDATICLGDSTPLEVAIGPFAGPYIVELTNGEFDSSYYAGDSIWVSPITTTTYSIVKLTDSTTGCSISAPDATLTGSATVTVNPLPTAQIADNDTICFGETAILTFSMTGQAPFTVTYRDNLTMQDSTFMTIGLATSRNITVAPLDTTIYSLVSVIDANGCVDSINNPNNPTFGDSVTIMVRPEPVANFTVLASVDTICAGDVSYLTANLTVGTEPYTISVSNGVGVINNFNSGDTIIVNPLVTTQYWIEQLTDADGCVVMAGSTGLPDTVTVQVDPLPTANLSGDATICFGDSTPLVLAMGPGTGPFIVELDNGAFDSSYYDMDSIWVSPTTTTSYNIVRITDSVTGCVINAPDATLTGSATVTVNPLPTAQIADNDTICFGETAILTFSMTGQAPFTVTYRDNLTMQDSTFMTIGLATSRNITVAPLDTTIYSLVSVIDANGCVDSINNPNNPTFGDSVTIMVRPEPVANFTVLASVDTICAGDVSYLTANLTVGTEPYTISVSNGVGVINNFNSGDTIIVNPLVTTQYWIEQLTDADGCVVMAGSTGLPDTVTVQVDPLPTANLSGDATICFGDSTPLVLAMGPGTGPFIVELDNGAFDSSYYDMDSIWVSPTTTTSYNIVRITDSVTGCVINAPDATLTGSATVTVNPLPTAQISQDDTICFDDNVVLTLSMTGQSPFTITFRDNTRMVDSTIVTIGTNTSHLVTVSPDSTTLYSLVSVIDGNGCIDSINNPLSPGFGDTIEIVVDSLPIADLVIDPLTDTICNLDTAFLIVNVTTGPGPYTVQISNGVGTINNYVSGTPIPVTPSADADYKILLLQDANGCSVTDGHPNIDTTVTVTVNPLPVVELKLDRNEICLGDSAQLFWSVAVGADPIRVVIDDDPTDTINAGINDSIWVSPIDTTTYSILYFEDGNGCAVSAPNPNISGSPTLIVNPLATASMFQDDTICYGETAELIFRIQGANAPYTVTYLDTGGAPITQFSVVDSTITPWLLEPGLNTFTLTNVVDDKGCIANLSADTIVDILVHELPTVVISGDTTVCEDEPVTLNFDFTGVGPFTVVYTNGITTDTAIGLTGPSDTVVVNLSPSPIPYVYTLVEAFDSNVPDACAATDLTGSASVIMYERARISWANGQDTTICDRDSYVLTFNVDGGRPTYSVDISWSDGITVDTTLTGIGDNSILIVSPSDTTTYTIVSAIEEFTTELCEAVVVDDSVVTIYVNELPTADVVVNGPTDVCFGDSIQLDFTFTGTGPWDLTYLTTYAGTLDTLGVTANPLVLKVAPPFPGSYDVSILSIVDGQTPQCQVFAPDANITGLASFTSHGLPTASLNPLGLTTVCRGDSTDLLVVAAGGTPPYRIFISDGAGYNVDTTFNSNTIIIPVAPTATTTFQIDSMMDSNALTTAGCMADTANLTGQVLVTVNTRPTIGISGVDTICSFENSSFQIDVTGTGPWFIQYSDGTNTFPTVANASPHTVTVINPAVGTNVYKIVSVQDNGIVPSCPQDSLPTDSAVIHVNDLPTAQLSGDTTICNGDLLPLALDFGVTNGPFTVRIVDGNGVPYTFTGLQSPTDTVLIPYTQTGLQTYFLDSVADDATTCEPLFAVGQAIVTIQPTVTVNLTGSDTICDGTFGVGFLGFDFTDPNGPAQGIFDVEILRNGTPVDTVFGVVSGVLVAAPGLQVGLNNYTVGFARYAIDPFCDLVVGTGADILVYPKPTATIQDDDSICFGSTAQLTFELTGTGPWDIRYLAGFTQEDTVATGSPFTITVAPTFTTTYSLVEVTDANNCTEAAFPITDSTEATVTVFQLPTAQLRINGIFGTSAAYCEEDTAALQVLLTGLGPFDIEIEDNLGNTFPRSGFNSGDTVQIHPPLGVSVKYWLKSVTDANQPACNPAALLDTMTIFQDPLPTADLNGDTTICLGATAPLTFDLTGVGPWTIRYYDGTFISQPINVTSSPFVLNVTPFTTTTYKIFDVVDAGTQNSCTIDSAHMNVTGSATVTVAPEVKAGFSFISNDKCGDPTITFTDTTTPPNVYSYFWRFGDGDTSTAQNPVHTYNNTTLNVQTYVVTMIATTAVAPLGCTDSASVQISVNPDIEAQLTVSEDSGCAPLTISFESTGPAVIRYWDFENGGTDLQPGNPSVDYEFANTGLSDLTYNVWHVVENQFGCRDTIIQDIVVHPLPQPAFTATPQVHQWPIVPVTFTNNTPNLNDNTYFWDFGDGVGAHMGPTPPPYTYPTWGDFNVVLTATTPFNCVDSFIDLVQVLPQLPVAALPGDTAIGCEGFEYTFTSTSEFAFTYEWKFSDGQTFNSETVTRTFQAAGGNGAPRFIGVTLVVTGLGGFQDSVTQDVIAIVNPIPDAAFTTSFDTVFAPNNSVNFNNFSRYFDSLKWDFGDGTVDYRVNPTHTYSKEGNYEITLVTFTDEGCTDTTTRPMVVRPTANIFVPNVFIPSPNGPNGGDISQATGQNINTIFYPVPNKPVKDIEFQVFNRWGEVIFESKDINKGWDGYIRENLAEQSVYIYRVDVKFQDGSEETIIGDVTLLR